MIACKRLDRVLIEHGTIRMPTVWNAPHAMGPSVAESLIGCMPCPVSRQRSRLARVASAVELSGRADDEVRFNLGSSSTQMQRCWRHG